MIGRNTMTKKGYGRVFVMDPGKVERVKEIMEALDEYEWSYYVKDVIVAFPEDGKIELIYTHKFEPCMDAITLQCWRHRIAVWCISQRNEDFGEFVVTETTPE